MKNKNALLMLSVLLLATASACGRNYSGSYRGTLTLNGASQQVTVTVNDAAANNYTATIAGATGSGSITRGTPQGDTISNVAVSFSSTPTYGVGTTTPQVLPTAQISPTSSLPVNCSFMGSLNVSNNKIVGNLTPATTALPGAYNLCTGMSLDVTKQ